MRTHILIMLCLLTGILGATLSTPSDKGSGLIAGKLAFYVSGDTIAFVYNDNTTASPSTIVNLVYKYSYNGGTSWYASIIDQVFDGFCHPTLSISPGEILVTYNLSNVRKLAKSTDGGIMWTKTNTGLTFEKSPRIERRGSMYSSFDLDIPYPEHMQSSFATIDNPEEMRAPQYITDQELSWNGTPVYFHGRDIVYGALRSNSTIWIKRVNLGTNSGWPTFLDPVVTSGVIQSDAIYPPASVFRGGLVTNAPPLEMVTTHPDFMQGTLIGPNEPGHIVLVTGHGSTFNVKVGTLTNPHQVSYNVYSSYPPGSGMIGVNTVTVCDTVWTEAPAGMGGDGIYHCVSQLWIRGEFSGHQTWSCTDSIMIAGDITLSGTTPGQAPDTPANPNLTDTVTLITSEKVILKYGYKDPYTGQRIHPLCKADGTPSYVYATIYAMNDDPDPRKDGCFTFEYQHPHHSIPAMNYNGNYYTNIDLHRYIYPQTEETVWPANVDLPWYNPLWPELQPYMERGIIQIWGSINQRRRGYMHRNWEDREYNTGGLWDPSIDACGGPSFEYGLPTIDPVLNVPITPANYPGTDGQGIGYKKDYKGDKRHEIDPRLFSWGLKIGTRPADSGTFETSLLSKYAKKIHTKTYATRGAGSLYCANEMAVYVNGDAVVNLLPLTGEDGWITSAELTPESHPLLCQIRPNGDHYDLKIKEIDPMNQAVMHSNTLSVATMVNDIAVMPGGRKVLAKLEPGTPSQLSFWDLRSNGDPVLIESNPLSILPAGADTKESRIWIVPSSANELEVIIWKKLPNGNSEYPYGTMYYAHAVLAPSANDDPATPVLPELRVSVMPNPMHAELKAELELNPGTEYQASVYNMRGQRVMSYKGISDESGRSELFWNGKDERNLPCGSGIYVIKIRAKGYPEKVKTLCKI